MAVCSILSGKTGFIYMQYFPTAIYKSVSVGAITYLKVKTGLQDLENTFLGQQILETIKKYISIHNYELQSKLR